MELLEQLHFLDPLVVGLFGLLLSCVIFLRFLLLSGLYHYFFYRLWAEKRRERILNPRPFGKKQLLREIYWSLYSALIFGLAGAAMVLMWMKGFTAIYHDCADYPLWYHLLSLPLALFLHDSYYYWMHRWMHIPVVYRYFHRVHHQSLQSNVLTAFSFHPLETLVQVLIFPLLIISLPMHHYVLFFILGFMSLSATVNHAGVEVYPKRWKDRILLKYLIGARHHDKHHRYFSCNYGLYFSLWDRWMGTERD